MSSSSNAAADIECHNVTKVYRGLRGRRASSVTALQNCSLSVARGRTVGLVGANGAGKSTLLGLIAGAILPTDGRVTICGHPARSIGARRLLGFMPESSTFQPLYTARAVLHYHGSLLRLPRRRIHEQAEHLLSRLGLSGAAQRRCHGFSLGMRQRLALGVALMGHPQVLLLDEPSNGLDPLGVVQLREILRELAQSGKTIFVSSHRLDELDKLTSEFVFLRSGCVVPPPKAIAAGSGSLIRVSLLGRGRTPLADLLTGYRITRDDGSEILVEVGDPGDVASVVARLAEDGAQIVHVGRESEGVERAFLRLCEGGDRR